MVTPFSDAARAAQASQKGAQYWTEGAEERDALKKKYRSIPVPAFLAQDQKHIDDKTRLELLVEFLGSKNEFTNSFPNVNNEPLEDQMALVKDWISTVASAPDEQKEDAQRSLGGHLKGFGGMIGKGLLKGVTEVLGAPGVSHSVDAISRPGEEVAGALIYNWQRWFQRGEQTFERNVHAYREANADKPWFKRGWYSPVARETGFNVPMGVHLPLEIIFDPLNFVPFGMLNKPIKYGASYLKLMAKTGDRAQSVRMLKRANNLRKILDQQLADLKANAAKDAEAAEEVLAGDPWDARDVEYRRQGGEYGDMSFTDPQRAWKPYKAMPERILREPGKHQNNKADVGHTYEDRILTELGLVLAREALTYDDVGWKGLDPGSNEYIDLTEGMPMGALRDAPDDTFFKRMLDEADVDADGIEPEVLDALYMLYHTGIRPHELKDVWWEDLHRQFQFENIDPMQDVWELPIVDRTNAAKPLFGQRRLMSKEAADWLKWLYIRTGQTQESGGQVFRHAVSNEPLDVKDINNAFRTLSEKYGAEGEKARSYYSKLDAKGEQVGNFSYVFRLNKANKTYVAGRDTLDSLETTMRTLGHLSPFHTSRYVSILQHNLANGERSIINMAVDIGGLKDVEALQELSKINKELNDSIMALGLKDADGRLLTKDDLPNASIFEKTSTARRASTKGFVSGEVASAVKDEIHNHRKLFLDMVAQNTHKLAYKLPEGIDDIAPEVRPAATYIQGLHQFTTFLLNSMHEKHFIANAEPTDMTKVTGEAKTALNRLRKEMNNDAAMLREWFDVIVELGHAKMKVLDPGIDARVTNTLSDYTDDVTKGVLDELWAPFVHLGSQMMESRYSQKQVGVSGGSRAKKTSLIDIDFFKDLLLRNDVTDAGNKRTGTKNVAARAAWDALSDEEKANAFRKGVGYIVSPGTRRVGKDVAKAEAAGKDPEGRRGRRTLWVVKEWRRADNSVTSDPHDITHAVVQKLGNEPYRADGTITLARDIDFVDIPLREFKDWYIQDDFPHPENVFQTVTAGGKQALQPHEIANIAFGNGIDLGLHYSADDIKAMFRGDPASGNIDTLVDRLRQREYLEIVATKGGRHTYRFTQETVQAFNARGGVDDPRFGWKGVNHGRGAQKPGQGPKAEAGGDYQKPPPRDPGARSVLDDLPEDNVHGRAGNWEDGRFVGLDEIIPQSRAQNQFLKGAGTDGGRWAWNPLYMLVNNQVPGVARTTRFFVGQTLSASKAAMLRWRYVLGKSQGTHVGAQVMHMLDGAYDAFGAQRTWKEKIIGTDIRRTGRATQVVVKGEINPATGEFADSAMIQRDYWRAGGETKYVRAGFSAKEGMKLGPVAVMEEEFKRLNRENPKTWNKARIDKERRRYNHKALMQDMSVILGTHRDDLDKFYVLTPEQLKYYEWYHQVMPQLYSMLRHEGIDVDSAASVLGIAAKDRRREFVPFLTGKELSGNWTAPRPMEQFGHKPPQFQEREYYWQIHNKMNSGQGMGRIKHEIYNTDPIIALGKTVEAYYEYVNQQRFMDEYAKLGILKPKKTQAVDVGRKIIQYHNGEAVDLSPAEIQHAEEFFGAYWNKDRGTKFMKDLVLERANQFQQMQDWAGDLGSQTPVQYAPTEHPLRQTLLPQDASKEFMALLDDEINPMSGYLTWPSMIANMMRVLATGADLGTLLLHGFGGLATTVSPTKMPMQQRFAWAKAARMITHGLLDSSVRREWYRSSGMVRDEMTQYNVAFFRSTHVEDLPLPGLFTKGELDPRLEMAGIKQMNRAAEKFWGAFPERLIQAFGFFLDVSKTEMWKAQSSMIKREYGLVDEAGNMLTREQAQRMGKTKQLQEAEEALTELAAGMNAIHGTLNPAVVGIPQKQRVFESAFLMYAAMYRRASVALVKNMLTMPDGNPLNKQSWSGTSKWRRGPALQAVSGMILAGAVIGAAIKMTGNNDEALDMGTADFMSARFGNDMRVGIGTPYYTMIRMGRDIFDQMKDDPKGVGNMSWRDNPVLKWGRSMTSPITSIGIDVGSSRSFIGEPYRDTSGGWEVNAIGSRVSRSLVPFWVDTAVDNAFFSKEMSSTASIPEFFGLRVSPIAAFGQLDRAIDIAINVDEDADLLKWRREQFAKGLPADHTTIPRLLKLDLEDRTPELQTIKDEISEDARRRGTQIRIEQDEYITKVEEIREGKGGLVDQLTGISLQFEQGRISGKDFREKIQEAEMLHFGKMRQLADDYKEVLDTFEERRVGRLDNPEDQFYLDLWFDKYRHTVTGAPGLHDEYGNFDINRFKTVELDFKMEMVNKGLGKEGWDYIQARRKQGKFLPGKVAELDVARQKLAPYWELHNATWGKTRPEYVELIDLWRQLGTQQAKDLWAKQNPKINQLLDRLKMIQDKYRRLNPDIDALLVEFYDYAPITRAGQNVLKNKRTIATQAVLYTTQNPNIPVRSGEMVLR